MRPGGNIAKRRARISGEPNEIEARVLAAVSAVTFATIMQLQFSPFDGVLSVDSFTHVVDRCDATLASRKLGHCGNARSGAMGLLIFSFLERATKLQDRLMSDDKSYQGSMSPGVSDDFRTAVLSEKPCRQRLTEMILKRCSQWFHRCRGCSARSNIKERRSTNWLERTKRWSENHGWCIFTGFARWTWPCHLSSFARSARKSYARTLPFLHGDAVWAAARTFTATADARLQCGRRAHIGGNLRAIAEAAELHHSNPETG